MTSLDNETHFLWSLGEQVLSYKGWPALEEGGKHETDIVSSIESVPVRLCTTGKYLQSNSNGSNTFGTMKISLRQG